MRFRTTTPVTAFLLLLTFALAGCSSTSTGEKMVQSYEKTSDMLTGSQQQVDATLMILSRLRNTPAPGLKDTFAQYKQAVAQLEKDAKDAAWRAQSMKEESDAHIQQWQSEMASIKDPEIKSTLASRREAARSNFKLIMMYADDVRGAYKPFLEDNQSIMKALSIDLSPTAVASLSSSIERVQSGGEQLKVRLGLMRRAMDNIVNGISPLGQLE